MGFPGGFYGLGFRVGVHGVPRWFLGCFEGFPGVTRGY